MEDPQIYELLSLMLDEMRENRKGVEQLAAGQQRQEILLQRQSEMLEQFLRTVAAPQVTKIIEIERRLDALERKTA